MRKAQITLLVYLGACGGQEIDHKAQKLDPPSCISLGVQLPPRGSGKPRRCPREDQELRLIASGTIEAGFCRCKTGSER